jgi:two-component system, chemotaxis family, sensor kinase CheA
VELKDRVEQISAQIRELRQAAGDGPRLRQLVDSIFRRVHSFKAAASTDGPNDLTRTAHELENLLHSLRTGKVRLTEDVVRALEDATATLFSGTYVPIEGFTSGDNTVSDAELPAEFANLKDEERHRAAEAVREGSNLYVMEVVFDASDFDRRFRELKQELDKTSEIISTSARMNQAGIGFRICYAARSAKIPVQTVFRQTIRAGNSIATSLGKEIEFVVRGEELLIEERISDAVADCLLHLVRNAVDHGIDSRGTVILEAMTDHDQIELSVGDNGRGINEASLPQIFQPGFSTAQDITELSGRGVGLDVVKNAVENLGGSVSVISEPGKGSSFKIIFPNQYS